MSIQRASFYHLLTVVTIAFIWLLIPYYSAVFLGRYPGDHLLSRS